MKALPFVKPQNYEKSYSSFNTSIWYISFICSCISLIVIPLAYSDITCSSNPLSSYPFRHQLWLIFSFSISWHFYRYFTTLIVYYCFIIISISSIILFFSFLLYFPYPNSCSSSPCKTLSTNCFFNLLNNPSLLSISDGSTCDNNSSTNLFVVVSVLLSPSGYKTLAFQAKGRYNEVVSTTN